MNCLTRGYFLKFSINIQKTRILTTCLLETASKKTLIFQLLFLQRIQLCCLQSIRWIHFNHKRSYFKTVVLVRIVFFIIDYLSSSEKVVYSPLNKRKYNVNYFFPFFGLALKTETGLFIYIIVEVYGKTMLF